MFCKRIVESDSGRVHMMRHNQQGSNMVAPNEGYHHARPHVPKFSEVYFTFGKHLDRHGEHHSRPKSWGLNQGPQGPNLVVERMEFPHNSDHAMGLFNIRGIGLIWGECNIHAPLMTNSLLWKPWTIYRWWNWWCAVFSEMVMFQFATLNQQRVVAHYDMC